MAYEEIAATKSSMSGESELLIERGSLIVTSASLMDAVNGLSGIALNNKMEVEKVINFFVNENSLALTATDRIVSSTVRTNCQSKGKFYFALNAKALAEILREGTTMTMRLYKERVTIQREGSLFDFKLMEPTVSPFDFVGSGQFELVPHSDMLTVLSNMSKFISTDINEFNAVMLNNGYAYTRDRLIYCITEFPIKGTIVLSKTMCKQIVTLLGRINNRPINDLTGIRYNEETGMIEMFTDKVCVKMTSFNYTPVDLTDFIKVFNITGLSVMRQELKDAIKDLKSLDNPSDVYIFAEQGRLRIRPVNENSRTSLSVKASLSDAMMSVESGFSFTVSLAYLEKILNGINSPSIAIAKQQGLAVIVGVEKEILIRYFISVM